MLNTQIRLSDLKYDSTLDQELEGLDTSFFDAYLSHKKAGDVLIQNDLHREAYLSLIMAAECFL